MALPMMPIRLTQRLIAPHLSTGRERLRHTDRALVGFEPAHAEDVASPEDVQQPFAAFQCGRTDLHDTVTHPKQLIGALVFGWFQTSPHNL